MTDLVNQIIHLDGPMSENYDLYPLAMSLLPKIPGLLMDDGVQRQLRSISWNYIFVAEATLQGATKMARIRPIAGAVVDAIYSAGEDDSTGMHVAVHAVPLYSCANGIDAEALSVALRELVYPRERLAGRMKPRPD